MSRILSQTTPTPSDTIKIPYMIVILKTILKERPKIRDSYILALVF